MTSQLSRIACRCLPPLLLVASAAAWAQATTFGQVFTCVNAAGRVITSDRLIGECMDREQRLLAKDGTLLRIVPPSLTADERAEKEARERRLAAEKLAKAAAVRRDRLLLERYPSEAEHRRARTSALEAMLAATKASEARIVELARERKPLLEEAEFYSAKTMPAKLKQQLESNDAAVAAQRDVQVQQAGEMERIGARFDAELAHLKRLWAGAPPGSIVDVADAQSGKANKPIKPTAAQSR